MLTLDLTLAPEDTARLARTPDLLRLGGKSRPAVLNTLWHDTPDGALADAGLSLAEERRGRDTIWRLERMRPVPETLWIPGTPPELVAEAADLASLADPAHGPMPGPLIAVAGFDGEIRDLAAGTVTVTLRTGVLRAVSGERKTCRLAMTGPDAPVAALSHALATTLRLSVPPTTLAAEAHAVARPPPAPRRLGAPSLAPGLAVGDAFAAIVAHLTDVILHYGPRAEAGEAPEPVHQLRVAMRRLRSAILLFRKAVSCPELAEATDQLRRFGHVLGPARDWDVFITGTGRAVADAFPDDAAVQRLAKAARRRRDQAYAALRAYLASPAYRALGLTLALLAATRPWDVVPTPPPEPDGCDTDGRDTETPGAPAVDQALVTTVGEADAGAADGGAADGGAADGSAADGGVAPAARQVTLLGLDLDAYAAKMLDKRHARLMAPGETIGALATEALHAIRLDGKRLRYAAEFFAPLFPGRETRRFLRRLIVLQERLGHLNDSAVAADLLAEIGHGRSHAGGIVRGFIAAGSGDARRKIMRAWRKMRRQNVFWH